MYTYSGLGLVGGKETTEVVFWLWTQCELAREDAAFATCDVMNQSLLDE